MTTENRIYPRQNFPDFTVPLVNSNTWSLSAQENKAFTLVVFYRGLHCPICSRYVADLQKRQQKFSELGVGVVAISSDTRERAQQAVEDWKLDSLDVGYGLELETAQSLGLYISSGRGLTSIGIEEPARFSEPGFFLVRPDQSLYFSSIQTMPFARPNFAEIASAIEFVVGNDYPARGEIVDL